MANIEEIIQELELEYIEFTSSDIEEKKARLPLTDERDIAAIIYNLFKSAKYEKVLSGRDISNILLELFKRIKK